MPGLGPGNPPRKTRADARRLQPSRPICPRLPCLGVSRSPWRRRRGPRSAGSADPSLVPDRPVGLVDLAVGAVDQEPVEAAGEPAVVGDRDDRARRRPRGPPRAPRPTARRGCRSARRAAAAWPRTAPAAGSGSGPAGRRRATRSVCSRGVGELVAVEHPGGRLAAHARVPPSGEPSPRCRISSSVRPSSSGWVVGLHEPAGSHAGTELRLAGVADGLDRRRVDGSVLDVWVGAAGGQQPQEVGLAGAVAAQHRDPLAVPDLEVERLHQPGQLQVARRPPRACRCGRP